MRLSEMMLDARLSSDARVLGFHVAQMQGEWIELGRDDCRRILHGSPGKDRVARALGEIELWDYVERRSGGKGHADSFRFSITETTTLYEVKGPENEDAKNSIPETTTLNAFSVRPGTTLKRTSSTSEEISTTAASSSAREKPAGWESLSDYLGDHRGALVKLLASAGDSQTWPSAIMGKWGPRGTQQHAWGPVPSDLRPAVLGTAIEDYAELGEEYSNRRFDAFMRTAINDERKRRSDDGRTNGSSRTGRSGTSQNGQGRRDYQIER